MQKEAGIFKNMYMLVQENDKNNTSHDYMYFQTGTICETTTLAETTRLTTSGGSTPCATFTSGGNGNGAMCVFPFTYQSVAYYQCITTGNNGQLWCATTPNYDIDGLWGNCQGRLASASSTNCRSVKNFLKHF